MGNEFMSMNVLCQILNNVVSMHVIKELLQECWDEAVKWNKEEGNGQTEVDFHTFLDNFYETVAKYGTIN